ncbi:MAG: L-threonylcarbamoyladenylate synthase [Capnocytophaga sp.]|nr:L-threonylcarbamoyladenylate synthase [Capnocytophaga sp.]
MKLLDAIIFETVGYLENKGTILYPTDTVWGIGCDATNAEAVQKVFQIKKREEKKSLILLVSDMEMLEKYVEISPEILSFLQKQIKPTTIIYQKHKCLINKVIAEDNSVAIRVVKNEFCEKLIRQFGRPIVSTSANISGQPTPHFFKQIDENIKKAVDFIVPLNQEKTDYIPPSQLVKIENNSVIFLRK